MKIQGYPRIEDEKSKYHGYLDESKVQAHKRKISPVNLQAAIKRAIANANQKSSREVLKIAATATPQERNEIYEARGKDLFSYFRDYCGDPASSAFSCHRKHFSRVAAEQFHNWALQKERMNSGWRYQYLARDCATLCKRFDTVSEIGSQEADFTVTVKVVGGAASDLNIYVSVKNRTNTMGGQDWPKAIDALERVAAADKNRHGPYLCVFGICIDRGQRVMKRERKSGRLYSSNTEVWMSDFFWPFFSNHSFTEIMTSVLEAIMGEQKTPEQLASEIVVPAELVEAFGKHCSQAGLIDNDGNFHDPKKLVEFFCGKPK